MLLAEVSTSLIQVAKGAFEANKDRNYPAKTSEHILHLLEDSDGTTYEDRQFKGATAVEFILFESLHLRLLPPTNTVDICETLVDFLMAMLDDGVAFPSPTPTVPPGFFFAVAGELVRNNNNRLLHLRAFISDQVGDALDAIVEAAVKMRVSSLQSHAVLILQPRADDIEVEEYTEDDAGRRTLQFFQASQQTAAVYSDHFDVVYAFGLTLNDPPTATTPVTPSPSPSPTPTSIRALTAGVGRLNLALPTPASPSPNPISALAAGVGHINLNDPNLPTPATLTPTLSPTATPTPMPISPLTAGVKRLNLNDGYQGRRQRLRRE
ncbi:hypothetical protein B0H17DRAFT_1337223 [Mycena rosella]|uniref:Uncharacterized protein n=1 Tax=Mycena rosella TaxID=1033263 RepID=A0AAD7CTJ3_MYCRO|nr:hypothetical protein B0H17DRAFT_1337223 [Mycena rosella]